ncbi:hypothetical protein DFH08DRAFT_417356 [Mycena albidolilacea]|uniref:F-box domain-containing protein n=1 Tax=Mycena albidolilacea TaxID=1033008 RepID=A0AAD7F136_9AGAR|nr:hypothetical protein DFH08DRAFT_417356 [Mycena albidolilacea]
MAQVCWQCGASSEPAIASESPPLRDFHRLLTSNDIPLDSEIPFIRDIASDEQKQVDTLEAAIVQLTRKRDEMVENIRQHCAILSPIRRVPPELVCEILALSLSSEDDGDMANEPPWHLGHICRFWRHCVLAYPALWSSITIPSSSSDPRPFLSMLEIQLVRCADAPLRVCWSPYDDRNIADPGSVNLVLAHSSRWRILVLDIRCKFYVPVSLDWLRPANGRLLALETFKVTGTRSRVEIPDIFSTIPSLRNVFLSNWTFKVRTSVPAIPWAQITRYSGIFDPDKQIEILEAAANLVSCALGFPNWNDVVRGIPIVLPRLRRLHLETPEFIHRLNTPLLEELIIHYWGGPTYGVPEILPFIQRSSCMLKTLVLRRCNVDFNLITVLQGLPSLTHLVIENDSLHSTPTHIAFFDALENDLCPNLTSMAFRVGSSDIDTRRLFAMARSRFQLEPPSARLAQLRLFGSWVSMVEPCPPHIAVEIQIMCDEGFDVSFVDSHEEETLKGKATFP